MYETACLRMLAFRMNNPLYIEGIVDVRNYCVRMVGKSLL